MLRKFLPFFLILMPMAAGAAPILPASNLHDDGNAAARQQQTIIILFSATYCTYCEAVKSEFFAHLENDQRYQGNVILREVVIDTNDQVRNFTGMNSTHRRFADNHDIYLVPTVGFFNGQGEEQARRMIGVANLDFYGWYLDIRIRNALKRIRDHNKELASIQGTTT